MEIRQAILAAAHHIESRPDLFEFMETDIPTCGTPGCALGWIGHFLGAKPGVDVIQATNAALGFNVSMHNGHPFYSRMGNLGDHWTRSAEQCAKNLRLYADKYHPEPRAMIPASVRAIFDMTPAQLAREFERA